MDDLTKSILLFGGTFDPIHLGHLGIARYVADELVVDKVIILPAAASPFKLDQQATSAEHRLAMARLAIADDDLFEVSDWEIVRSGASYSLNTIHFFEKKYPGAKLYWLIGADCLEFLHKWHRIKDMVEICQIVTAARPGFEFEITENFKKVLSEKQIESIKKHIIKTPLYDISSTKIREFGPNLPKMVPETVYKYILDHDLYR